jgi:hypothetical protein
MTDTPTERPSPPAANVGGEVTPPDLPAHNAYTACPKCGTTLIEHHKMRYHEAAMPLDLGRDMQHQESCARMASLGTHVGEHLCHLCDVCGHGWVSQIAEPADG